MPNQDNEPSSEQQPSTSGQSGGRSASFSSLADSFGSQKAFVSEDEWRVMDKKVNKYPSQRVFTAIGTGGDDFKTNMKQAVEEVVGTVHLECVSERPSSGGKYVSVRIGPVWVENADQVVQVFTNMRKDERLKWYM